MSTIQTARSAKAGSHPNQPSPTGHNGTLNGQEDVDTHSCPAVEDSVSGTARPAKQRSTPRSPPPAGHSGQGPLETQTSVAAEGHTSPQATHPSAPNAESPAGNRTARPATDRAAPIAESPAGHTQSLSGQRGGDTHTLIAAEGQDSPQAIQVAVPTHLPPAGTLAAQPAKVPATPTPGSLAGHQNGRGQSGSVTQSTSAPASDLPGAQTSRETHRPPGTGDHTPPAATEPPAPNGAAPLADGDQPAAKDDSAPSGTPPLADPLLALASDVLGDLEKVRIANENRLRQLTRSVEDSDGETRGFGFTPPGFDPASKDLIKDMLAAAHAITKETRVQGRRARLPDGWHPDVWNLALIILGLSQAEHAATLNLARMMRNHPLGPWVKAQKGVGEKQAARLLAAIGDPYIRPEFDRKDGTVEPSRPRKVSELWAFAGYHVVKIPVSGQRCTDAQTSVAADGTHFPAGQHARGTQSASAGGEQNGHPGHTFTDTQKSCAGVAPKRARGQKANWSGAAKMRAYLVAESCIKQLDGGYRAVYEATREKYADAAHAVECIRCGPKGRPAQPGSPLSAGHQHARALRAVAKEILRDLWREARRLHTEAPVSGHCSADTQFPVAADGHSIPAGHGRFGTQSRGAGGDQAHSGPDGGAA